VACRSSSAALSRRHGLRYAGDRNDASAWFDRLAGLATAGLAERSIWLGDFIKARALADKAWKLASHLRYERDFIIATLLQGRVALGLGDLTRADERLHHALTRTRAVNVVEYELPTLISIAELKLAQGRPEETRTCLDDVWDSAERGRYPLDLADAYNVLADIELAAGAEPQAAQRCALSSDS